MSKTTLDNKPAALSQSADFGESDCQICIQCLAAYNQGFHHFFWCDLEELNSEDLETFQKELRECINFVIETSPAMGAEEHFYTDHCGINSIYSEYMDAETLFNYLEGLREAKAAGYSHELWENYLSEIDPSDTSFDNFQDTYYGAFESGEEFAEHIATEGCSIPDGFPTWIDIDWEGTWQNLSYDYHEVEADGMTHFFTA